MGSWWSRKNIVDIETNNIDQLDYPDATLYTSKTGLVDTEVPVITADTEATAVVTRRNVLSLFSNPDYINLFNVSATDNEDGDITSDVVVDDS